MNCPIASFSLSLLYTPRDIASSTQNRYLLITYLTLSLSYVSLTYMKEYPISFLVRLQPKHKNLIIKGSKKAGVSEAAYIRMCIEFPPHSIDFTIAGFIASRAKQLKTAPKE